MRNLQKLIRNRAENRVEIGSMTNSVAGQFTGTEWKYMKEVNHNCSAALWIGIKIHVNSFLLGFEGFPADSAVKEQNDGTAKLLFVL